MTNAMCPFLHEPMDRSTSVDLRCGHRFALSRLQAARRAADLCYAAGFARKDALICPLCGDQASFNTPGASKTLTTYSSDAAAYLGDLRRDWQQPVQLPVHSWMLGREAGSYMRPLAHPPPLRPGLLGVSQDGRLARPG